MKFYWFDRNRTANPEFDFDEFQNKLIDFGFDGALFTYGPNINDFFTKIARYIKLDSDFKYMVAVRPYLISPQYLCKINNSINTIAPNRLQINLISAQPTIDEQKIGGVLGDINDLSSTVDRSNYLIKYLNTIHSLNMPIPELYITTTNEFVYNTSTMHQDKMIIPYRHYLTKKFNFNNSQIMLSINPRLSKNLEEFNIMNKDEKILDTAFFTYDGFLAFLNEIKQYGINEILLYGNFNGDNKSIFDFIKKYKQGDFDDNL